MEMSTDKCYKTGDLSKLLFAFKLNLPKSMSCKTRSNGSSGNTVRNCRIKKGNKVVSCTAKKHASGNTFNFAMTCDSKKGRVMEMHGSSVVESDTAVQSHMNMTAKGKGKTMRMTGYVWANRVGECTASSDK